MAWKNVQYENGKLRTSEGGGGGSSTFADLDDVNFSNLQDGQVPKYNSETHKWENANESGGGGTVTDVEVDGVSVVNQQGVAEITMPTPPSVPDELSDLSDVQFSNLADNQPLRYNATSQKWVNGADNYPPLIYSDEEREVGVWRDGKPLYQRTFVVQKTTVGTETLLDLSSLNIESCVQTTGWFINSGGTHSYIPLYTSSSDFAIAYYQRGYLNGYNGGAHTKSIWNITLQYTKTTDTAGSGTWTTQGALAHHYSTTEKVIGTWTDGKPVYEIVKPITTTSGNYNFDVSSLNIDFLIDLKIQIKNVNGGSYCNGTYWQATNDYFNYYLNSTKQIITFRSGSGYAYGTGLVVLQYTKTTD